jgi:hypothetical protein
VIVEMARVDRIAKSKIRVYEDADGTKTFLRRITLDTSLGKIVLKLSGPSYTSLCIEKEPE